MSSSLSNINDNVAGRVHKIKCQYRHDDKNVKLIELNTNFVGAFLNTQTLKII